VVELSAVQNLLASWWFVYDGADFDAWPDHFTADARFSCRSDSGATAFEDFIRADVHGREEVLAWQIEHRRNSPYPLRHNGTNIHLADARAQEADFRSYIFVTQIVGGAVSNLASGVCTGTARVEDGALRLADLALVLDFTDSEPLAAMS
jgi:SnoaL-like protein